MSKIKPSDLNVGDRFWNDDLTIEIEKIEDYGVRYRVELKNGHWVSNFLDFDTFISIVKIWNASWRN